MKKTFTLKDLWAETGEWLLEAAGNEEYALSDTPLAIVKDVDAETRECMRYIGEDGSGDPDRVESYALGILICALLFAKCAREKNK